MNPVYDFSGQVALVVGASTGIGAATARAFAQSGASVLLADVDGEAVIALSRQLESEGYSATGLACDVTVESQVASVVRRTVEVYGRLDFAYNNAGVQAPSSDFAELPADEFDRLVAINQRGIWACMKHELWQMRSQGYGAIVNCASVGGLVGQPNLAPYNGTKHAVLGMTKGAALEYAARGIRINAVCPGTVNTPMVATMMETQKEAMEDIMIRQVINRLGEPEEIAAAVLWLCSPGASFVVGIGLPVDGGFTAN
ncbi:glucose 1-dehydrogenase [Rahnella bruchi]|uniref:glucose 1-dehydrogenase n=1 Tax=Rahnella bruchi TaxID=1510573 RepID=UPI000EA056EA|nr:glucose 1-dehydrogenase [Rahnella bruchi]